MNYSGYSANMQAKQALDPRELQMLEGEMRHREKSVGIAFLLWILAGTLFLHRVYLNRGNGALVASIICWVLWIVGVVTLLLIIGLVFLFAASIMALVLFIFWLIDAFSLTKWVEEYNERLEHELIGQLLAAKGIVLGGAQNHGPQQQAPAQPNISVNVAAASNAPAQAWGGAPTAADPRSAAGTSGRVTYVESGRSATLMVNPGEQVLIGRDTNARIRLSDPKASRQHALLQRSGADWLVRDLGATNPTRLLGPGGAPQNVQGEIKIASGQLLIGDVLVTLFPAGA